MYVFPSKRYMPVKYTRQNVSIQHSFTVNSGKISFAINIRFYFTTVGLFEIIGYRIVEVSTIREASEKSTM